MNPKADLIFMYLSSAWKAFIIMTQYKMTSFKKGIKKTVCKKKENDLVQKKNKEDFWMEEIVPTHIFNLISLFIKLGKLTPQCVGFPRCNFWIYSFNSLCVCVNYLKQSFISIWILNDRVNEHHANWQNFHTDVYFSYLLTKRSFYMNNTCTSIQQRV